MFPISKKLLVLCLSLCEAAQDTVGNFYLISLSRVPAVCVQKESNPTSLTHKNFLREMPPVNQVSRIYNWRSAIKISIDEAG